MPPGRHDFQNQPTSIGERHPQVRILMSPKKHAFLKQKSRVAQGPPVSLRLHFCLNFFRLAEELSKRPCSHEKLLEIAHEKTRKYLSRAAAAVTRSKKWAASVLGNASMFRMVFLTRAECNDMSSSSISGLLDRAVLLTKGGAHVRCHQFRQ
jgi:hypothetical protein